MKTLNEFNTGYPTIIGNAQNQEYGSVLSPIDAQSVESNKVLKASTAEGLHRLNNFINYFFKRTTLNPANEVNNLRVRLNHMNLDFPFDANSKLEEVNNFVVTEGGSSFGVTPTTDLSQGFDTGKDLRKYNLQIRVMKTDDGYKCEGKLSPLDAVTESYITKSKREDRINKFKKFLEKKKSE